MLDTLVPEYSQLRRPPRHVVAGLRVTDPTADLVYLGWGKWVLVSVQADKIDHWYQKTNGQWSTLRRDAISILVNARRLLELWRANPKFQANPGAFRRLIGRYDFALLATMGARPIAEYQVQGEPTSAIVDDFRRMDWMYRHTSDEELERLLEAPAEERRAEALADLTDEHRHLDAWRYLTTRTHTVTRFDDPSKTRGPKSGFARVMTIS